MKQHLKRLNDSLGGYGVTLSLIVAVVALGLSGYNTYVLYSGGSGGVIKPTKKIDKLNMAEVDKMIRAGAHVLGNPGAKVAVVEFADFQCPYCGKYQKQVFPEIKQKYIDTGLIKFVYVNYAFLGEESVFAAEASKCASDQNKFWQYHDYLYENQQGENRGAFSVENLKSFAGKLGLDKAQFDQCLDSRKYKNKVMEDKAMAERFGVTGTPATFVNGFYISGLQGVSYFTNRIDATLKGE